MHGACSTRRIEEDNQVAALVQVYNDGTMERMQLDGLKRSRNLGIGSRKINTLSVMSTLPIKDNIQPLLEGQDEKAVEHIMDPLCSPRRTFASFLAESHPLLHQRREDF
jgi:hypothetical protein